MPVLATDKVFRSRDPQLLVENELPVGRYRFQLTVVDGDRNESAPAEITVSVVKPTRPGRFDNIVVQPDRDLRNILRDVETPIRPIRRDRPNG